MDIASKKNKYFTVTKMTLLERFNGKAALVERLKTNAMYSLYASKYYRTKK